MHHYLNSFLHGFNEAARLGAKPYHSQLAQAKVPEMLTIHLLKDLAI
jgi:hypothetical protein